MIKHAHCVCGCLTAITTIHVFFMEHNWMIWDAQLVQGEIS